jgi:hypothetical protein
MMTKYASVLLFRRQPSCDKNGGRAIPRTSASDVLAVSYRFSNLDFLSVGSGEGERDCVGEVCTEDRDAVRARFLSGIRSGERE